MAEQITCIQCGAALNESRQNESEAAAPCLKCGGRGRNYTLFAEPGVFRVTGFAADFSMAFGTGGATPTPEPLPSILLQAVVTLGAKTEEGRLIEAIAPAWFEIARLIQSDPDVMYQIDPRKWEEMIAGWYELHGFNVTLTPRSGDFGRDVIAEKPGVLSIRIIDQVKAYAPDHRVPANDVRALLGVLQADRAANKGLVTTTADFAPGIHTDPYIAPFVPTRLELVNGTELVRRLVEIAARK